MSTVTRTTLSVCAHLLFFIGVIQASYIRESRWQDLNHNRVMKHNISSICVLLNVSCERDASGDRSEFITKIKPNEFKSGSSNIRDLQHLNKYVITHNDVIRLNSNFDHNPEGRKNPSYLHAAFYNVPYVLKRRRREAENAFIKTRFRNGQLENEKNIAAQGNRNNEHFTTEGIPEPDFFFKMMLKIKMRLPAQKIFENSDFMQPVLARGTSTILQLHTFHPKAFYELSPNKFTSPMENKEIIYTSAFKANKIKLKNTRHISGIEQSVDFRPVRTKRSDFYSSAEHLLVTSSRTQFHFDEQSLLEYSSSTVSKININIYNNFSPFNEELSSNHLKEAHQSNLNINQSRYVNYKASMLETSGVNSQLQSSEVIENNIFYTNIAFNDPITLFPSSFQLHDEAFREARLNDVLSNDYTSSKYISPSTVLPDSLKPTYDFNYRTNHGSNIKTRYYSSRNFHLEPDQNKAKTDERTFYSKQKSQYLSNFDSIKEKYIKSSLSMKFETEFSNSNANFMLPEKTPSLPLSAIKVTSEVTKPPITLDSAVTDSLINGRFWTKKLFLNTISEAQINSILTFETVAIESFPNIFKSTESVMPSETYYTTDYFSANFLQDSVRQSRYHKDESKEVKSRVIQLNKNTKNYYPSPDIYNPKHISFTFSSDPIRTENFLATKEYLKILDATEISAEPSNSIKIRNSYLKIKPDVGELFGVPSFTEFIVPMSDTFLPQPVYKTVSTTNNGKLVLKNSLFKISESSKYVFENQFSPQNIKGINENSFLISPEIAEGYKLPPTVSIPFLENIPSSYSSKNEKSLFLLLNTELRPDSDLEDILAPTAASTIDSFSFALFPKSESNNNQNRKQHYEETMRLNGTLGRNIFKDAASPKDYIRTPEVEAQSLQLTLKPSKSIISNEFYQDFESPDPDLSTQMPIYLDTLKFLDHTFRLIDMHDRHTLYGVTKPISSVRKEISVTLSDDFDVIDSIGERFPSIIHEVKSTDINPSYDSIKFSSDVRNSAEISKAGNTPMDFSSSKSAKFIPIKASEKKSIASSISSYFYEILSGEMVKPTKSYFSKRADRSNEGIYNSDIIHSTNKGFTRIENSRVKSLNDLTGLSTKALRNESFSFMENELTENDGGNTEDNLLLDVFNCTNKNLIRTERDLSENTETASDEISGYDRIDSSNRNFLSSERSSFKNNENASISGTLLETHKIIFNLKQILLKNSDTTTDESSLVDLTTITNKSSSHSVHFVSESREATTDFVSNAFDFTSKYVVRTDRAELEKPEITEKGLLQGNAFKLISNNATTLFSTNSPKNHKSTSGDDVADEPLNNNPKSIVHTDSNKSGRTASSTNEVSSQNTTITDLNTPNSEGESNILLEIEVSTNDISRIPANNVSNENITNYYSFPNKDNSTTDTGLMSDSENKSRIHTEQLEDSDKTAQSSPTVNVTSFFDKTILYSEGGFNNFTDAGLTFEPFRFSDERIIRTERDVLKNTEINGDASFQSNLNNFSDKETFTYQNNYSRKDESSIDTKLVWDAINRENKSHVHTDYNISETSDETAKSTGKKIVYSTEGFLENNYSVSEAAVTFAPTSFTEDLTSSEHDGLKITEINANISLRSQITNFADKTPMLLRGDFSGNDSAINASLISNTIEFTENSILNNNHGIAENINESIGGNASNFTEKSTMRSKEVSSDYEDNTTDGNVDPFSFTDKSFVRTERDLQGMREVSSDYEDNATDGNVDPFSFTDKSFVRTERDLQETREVSSDYEDNATDGNVDPFSFTDKSFVRTERDFLGTREVSFGNENNATDDNMLLYPTSFTNKSFLRTENDFLETTENVQDLNSVINLPYFPNINANPPETTFGQDKLFDDNDEFYANNLRKNLLTEHNLFENTESSASKSNFDIPDLSIEHKVKSTDSSDVYSVHLKNNDVKPAGRGISDKTKNSSLDIDLANENVIIAEGNESENNEGVELAVIDEVAGSTTATEQHTVAEKNKQVDLNVVGHEEDITITEREWIKSTESFDLDNAVLHHTSEKYESSDLGTINVTNKSTVSTESSMIKVTESFELGAVDLLNRNISAERDVSEYTESSSNDFSNSSKSTVKQSTRNLKNLSQESEISIDGVTESLNPHRTKKNIFSDNEAFYVVNLDVTALMNISSTESGLFQTTSNFSTNVIDGSSTGFDTTSIEDEEIIRTEREILLPEDDVPGIELPKDVAEETEITGYTLTNSANPHRTDGSIFNGDENFSVVNFDVNRLVNKSNPEFDLFDTTSNYNVSTDVSNDSSTSFDTISFAGKEIVRTEREISLPEDVSDVEVPDETEDKSIGIEKEDESVSSEVLASESFEQNNHHDTGKDISLPKTTSLELSSPFSTEFRIKAETSESTNIRGKEDISPIGSENQPANVLKTVNTAVTIPNFSVESKSENFSPATVDNNVMNHVLTTKGSDDESDFTESESRDQTTFSENDINKNEIDSNKNGTSLTKQINHDIATERSFKDKIYKPEKEEENSTVRKTAGDFIPTAENSLNGKASVSITTIRISIDESALENDAADGLNAALNPTTLQSSSNVNQASEDVNQEPSNPMSLTPLQSPAGVNPLEESLHKALNPSTNPTAFTEPPDSDSLDEDEYDEPSQESRAEEDKSDNDESDVLTGNPLDQSTGGMPGENSEGISTEESFTEGINSNSMENRADPKADSNGKSDTSTSGTTESPILPFHFTIDADYDEVVGSKKNEFEASLTKQLGIAMRVPLECVQNLRVSKGSIEVNFDLVPNADHGHLADEAALKKAADELKRMIDSGQLTINDLKGNTMVVIPIDPPTQPPTASEVEHTSLILGVVIGAFILTVIMVAITAIIVKRKNSSDQRLTPIEEARSKLPSYREIPFQEALFVKGGPNKLIFGKYNYDTGRWLGPGPEPRPYEPPNSVVYRPPTDSEIRQTPRPPTAVRERLKNDWELDWDSLVSSR